MTRLLLMPWALAAALGLLAACGTAPAGSDLVVAVVAGPSGFDPAAGGGVARPIVEANALDALLRLPPGASVPEPGLAASWALAADGRSALLRLRPGVEFHDGTPCDAAAVVRSLAWRREAARSPRGVESAYPFGGDPLPWLAKAEAEGRDAVRLSFTEPDPPGLLRALAAPALGVVAPAVVDRGADAAARDLVGTGPFRVALWERDRVVLEANRGWWGGAPASGRVVLRAVADAGAALAALESGEAHLALGVPSAAAPPPSAARRTVVLDAPAGPAVAFLALNHGRPSFASPTPRRAVAAAIDKESLLAAAGTDAIALWGFVPPCVAGAVPMPPLRRDLPGSRALLRESGVLGARLELLHPDAPRVGLPDPSAVAGFVASELRAIGLEVTPVPLPWPALVARAAGGDFDLALLAGAPAVVDTEAYLRFLAPAPLSGEGPAAAPIGYRSDEARALLDRVHAAGTSGDRHISLGHLQGLVRTDAVVVPLYAVLPSARAAEGVRGFVLEAGAPPRFAGAVRTP